MTLYLKPCLRFRNSVPEDPHIFGREDTDLSAEIIVAFTTHFDTVKLHRPTTGAASAGWAGAGTVAA